MGVWYGGKASLAANTPIFCQENYRIHAVARCSVHRPTNDGLPDPMLSRFTLDIFNFQHDDPTLLVLLVLFPFSSSSPQPRYLNRQRLGQRDYSEVLLKHNQDHSLRLGRSWR